MADLTASDLMDATSLIDATWKRSK